MTHYKADSITERYATSSSELIGVVGYSDDDGDESIDSSVFDQIAEAEDLHLANCHSMHNEYLLFVSTVVLREPRVSEITYNADNNILFHPLYEVAYDDLDTIENCEFFFDDLEQFVGRGFRAALGEL